MLKKTVIMSSDYNREERLMTHKERFFITGGMGYIGAAFAQEALRRGHDVCLYDSLIYEQNVTRMINEITAFNVDSSEFSFVLGDTRNRELLTYSLRQFKPTYVMHWAELSSVYACNHNPSYTEEINYNASKQVMDVCEELGLRVFYNSSSSVYGVQKEMKLIAEKDPVPAPTDFYVRFKLKMEEYIKNKVAANPKFRIIVFRPATVFGLSPRFRIELLPNHFTYMAVANKNIPVSELNAFRAAIDIKELIQGYFKVIERGDWKELIYNIGHHNISKRDFALGIQKVVDCKISLAADIGDLRNLQIDCSLFDNEFNFHPTTTYEETIKVVAAWIEKNLIRLQKSNFTEVLNMPLANWHKICN